MSFRASFENFFNTIYAVVFYHILIIGLLLCSNAQVICQVSNDDIERRIKLPLNIPKTSNTTD